MPDHPLPYEAEIVHELPDEIAAIIGHVMVAYAKLEHKLTSLTGLLLQLNKTESRIVLRTPRAVERLDMALDIFAIKDIQVQTDVDALRLKVETAAARRDLLAHRLWLQHPENKTLFLRLTRGQWPKSMTRGERITRAVFPQSIPYGVEDCRETLALVETAIAAVDDLGAEIDNALQAYPERFRAPSPVLNPLGRRKPKGSEPRP